MFPLRIYVICNHLTINNASEIIMLILIKWGVYSQVVKLFQAFKCFFCDCFDFVML